jgi:tetratricopeptide (TPR) repeat protein
MLVDQGAFEIGPERWSLYPERLLATRVPQTLTGVLQARLDGLKAPEKLALQQASVIGFVFWDLALAAIDPQAPESLRSLVQRDLVVPHQDTSLDGAREYAFKHQILHHVTYDTVLKRMRRECHAKAAAWLAGLTGARAHDFVGATAEHYERAGELARAVEYFARAAEQAADRYSHEAALGYVASALALMGEDDHAGDPLLRWRLIDVRQRTLGALGRRADQQGAIDALQRLADALNDDTLRAKVAWRRSYIATRTGDFGTAARAAREAVALAETVGAVELQLDAQRSLAIALVHLGDAEGGKRLAMEGLAAARHRGLRRVEGGFVNTLSVVADRQHDVIATLDTTRQWLVIKRELGNRQNEAIALSNLGFSWLDLGEFTQARENLEAGLKLARAVGHRTIEPYPLTGVSRLALWQGDPEPARVHAQAALDIASAVQDRYIETRALACLGNAELALGRDEEATTAFTRARDVALAIGDMFRYDATAGLGRAALARGDAANALGEIESLLAHLDGGGTLAGTDSPGLIRVTCYNVLARAGDPRAVGQLSAAHAELMTSAAKIGDPALRKSFLDNIPEHREIVATSAGRP